MAVASKKKKGSTIQNGSLDIKNIDSKQMLFFVLQDIKTSISQLDNRISQLDNRINQLDNKIDRNHKELDNKIDTNFRWTIGIMITTIGIMIGGFIGIIAVILSKH